MRSDVIDNKKQRLAERMQELLSGASSAQLAVGYLFLDGLLPLREQINALDSFDILIGNVVNRLTEEQIREEAVNIRRGGEESVRDQEDVAATLKISHDRAALETALNMRQTLDSLPRNPEISGLLLEMAAKIASGKMRVRLYTRGRIHAKLALVHYPQKINAKEKVCADLAVVGSSNITLGAPAHPTELNIIVRDKESVSALSHWYQQLWDASQDFHRELFDELGQCWALTDFNRV